MSCDDARPVLEIDGERKITREPTSTWRAAAKRRRCSTSSSESFGIMARTGRRVAIGSTSTWRETWLVEIDRSGETRVVVCGRMLVRFVPALLLVGCASAGVSGNDPDPDASVAADSPKSPADTAPPSDSPPANLCASTATCQTAVQLGTVSGDTGNVKLAATTGHQSAWFRVRVTENDSDLPGLTLRVVAKLTSPAANDYDVFVYVNSGSDAVECATTTGTTTTTGTVNENRAEWGEGVVPNGSDDGRDVSIEVRPIGTSCSAAAPWTLDVEGNWL